MLKTEVTLQPSAPVPPTPASSGLSWRSWAGINLANFFLAEVTGVTLPFITTYLKEQNWQPLTIGLATAAAGLGVFLAQTPAGIVTDRIPSRRLLLAVASVLLGVCYGILPLVPATAAWVDPLLFVSGCGQAFFLPLLGALALGLVGHAGLGRMMGVNQGFNHAGNLAAALVALALVSIGGVTSVFYAVLAVSVLSSASVFLIRTDELDETRAAGDGDKPSGGIRALFHDRRVVVLFAATALFHLANAPVMPLVAQDVKELGGTDRQVAYVVLVAQAVMIPVALLAGKFVDSWGRKPVFAIGFIVLPVRIALYAVAATPEQLVWLQALDGIGAGIYGVAVVAMCADLTKGKGGFNALSGVIATALAVGGVIGPVCTGALTQYLGYGAAFGVFAGVAALAAVLFVGFMPETKEAKSNAG
ncbi:MFS transporter [Fimbriiglobus ruber]|uniref:Major facilitator superfamily n=1 Tax=Fimbriiglobus ruber TaxID=1908690 RepID=A0A225DGT6_9BACT|nr:MFS transporter [Fimbriiglobus ruber]OWK35605.1 Major facilitator superfamily [Fimbriiglobus ruber]